MREESSCCTNAVKINFKLKYVLYEACVDVKIL